MARRGSFQAKERDPDAFHVNIGAYVDEGTMGHLGNRRLLRSNRQERAPVGRRGHGRRAGTLQANPTIIEDNCFIGARSEVVEGVIVEENSVISMGVYIGQSTKIYDRATGEVSLRPHPRWFGGGVGRQPASGRWRTACTAP